MFSVKGPEIPDRSTLNLAASKWGFSEFGSSCSEVEAPIEPECNKQALVNPPTLYLHNAYISKLPFNLYIIINLKCDPVTLKPWNPIRNPNPAPPNSLHHQVKDTCTNEPEAARVEDCGANLGNTRFGPYRIINIVLIKYKYFQ